MKRFLLFPMLALFALASANSAYAQSKAKDDTIVIDPEQQIWLQLPTTTVPVQAGIHFVIVDGCETCDLSLPYLSPSE